MRILRFLLALFVVLAVSAAAFVWHLTAMPGESFHGSPPVTDPALEAELARVVRHLSVEIGERNISNAPKRLEEAAGWLRGELQAMGYTVTAQRFEAKGVMVENLVVERRGATRPGEIVVVGGHYDSAPGTPGADDNATGVAATLSLARTFATRQPARTVRFMFFTNEEPPHFRTRDMGSVHAAALAKEQHEDLRAVLSLETMGYADPARHSQHSPWPLSAVSPDTGDFLAFVASTDSRPLAETCVRVFREHGQVASEGVAAPAFVQGIDWSDHGPYAKAGYQALMVTDTALFRNPHYHEASDLPPTLNFSFLARATTGLSYVVEHLAQ